LGIFGSRRNAVKDADPSDLLIAFCGLTGDDQLNLSSIILDYQGGGILSTPESIGALRRIPTEKQQAEMGELSGSILEGLEASGNTSIGQAICHGIFTTNVSEMFQIEFGEFSPFHKAIASGTVNAMIKLFSIGEYEPALYVGLLGQCLFLNSTNWESSR